jgi:hypothetical protein
LILPWMTSLICNWYYLRWQNNTKPQEHTGKFPTFLVGQSTPKFCKCHKYEHIGISAAKIFSDIYFLFLKSNKISTTLQPIMTVALIVPNSPGRTRSTITFRNILLYQIKIRNLCSIPSIQNRVAKE